MNREPVTGLPVTPAAAWHCVDATTRSAARPERMTRRERKATARVLVLVVFCLVPFAVRMVAA